LLTGPSLHAHPGVAGLDRPPEGARSPVVRGGRDIRDGPGAPHVGCPSGPLQNSRVSRHERFRMDCATVLGGMSYSVSSGGVRHVEV
jgi:hypothetical protein